MTAVIHLPWFQKPSQGFTSKGPWTTLSLRRRLYRQVKTLDMQLNDLMVTKTEMKETCCTLL